MAAYDIGPRVGIEGEAQFKASIDSVNAQIKALGAEMNAVTAEYAKNATSQEALAAKNQVLGQSIEAANRKLGLLENQLTRQREKLSALGKTLDDTAKEFGESSKEAGIAQNAYNRQAAQVAKLEMQYQQTKAKLVELNNEMEDVGGSASKAGQAMNASAVLVGTAAWDGIKTAVREVAEAIKECIQVSMEFDSSIADVAATMGTTVSEIGDLREFAMDMGANTVFTATEAGQALNYMALAGYDAEEAMTALPNVLNLAAAGAIDLASASDMVTDAQSALGLSMEQSAVLVDEMAKTSTKTNTSVAQLGEAILTVGGTAKYMVGGTTEINQLLGILADNSIKGAEGGTKLRNIILSLTAPTDAAAATMEELGLSVFNADGQLRAFSEIFPELQDALSKLTDEEQLSALSEIFNSRDIAAAQALLGTSVERWNELDVAIQNAAGSAEKMAKTKLDNLAGDLTLLESAADGARIAFADGLTPALRDVTQAGTEILTFAGELAENFPLLSQVLAGATAGVATLTVGMGAMAAAAHLGIESIDALTAQIAASPIAPYAAAVGVAVTVLTAVASAFSEASEENSAFLESLNESKAAFEETTGNIQQEADNTLAMVSALENLAAVENKSAGQKQAMAEMVDQLNQAVPELSLAYDELNDSLNMTAESITEIAKAQAEQQIREAEIARLSELYVEQAQIATDLATAEYQLAEAQAAVAEAQEAGTYGAVGYEAETMALEQALLSAKKSVNALTDAQNENQESLDGLEGKYDDIQNAVEDTGDTAKDTAQRISELTDGLADLSDGTKNLSREMDTLSSALQEQQKSGSLSVDTTLDLVDAGYAAALSINEETGAITLNKAAYIEIAKAKLDDQIASLQTQQTSLATAIQLQKETVAVLDDAMAYYELKTAKDKLEGMESKYASNKAQIAALEKLKNSLGSVTTAVKTTSSAVKKQAEKDLDTYKKLKAELDHEQAMGLISEQEYYAKLKEYRDRYLTDNDNLDEYRKITEDIYKYDQSALEKRTKLWEDANQKIIDLEDKYQQELQARVKEIVNSYGLFDEVPEREKVAGSQLIQNLEEQITAIDSFYSDLNTLAERGVSESLVDDIREMGVGAAGELEGLLSLTDEQLSKYSELYQEKQALANQIAMEELEDLREATNTEIMSQMDDIASLYDENAPGLGYSFAEGLADGIWEGLPLVEQAAKAVANAAMSAGTAKINRDVEDMMTTPSQRVTSDEIGNMLAGTVNGMSTAMAGNQNPVIKLQMNVDGKEFYTETVGDLRSVLRSAPEVKDD